MIVDVHAHCWPSRLFFADGSSPTRAACGRRHGEPASRRTTAIATTLPPDEDVVSIVFGGKARLTGVWVDDADVAALRRPGTRTA